MIPWIILAVHVVGVVTATLVFARYPKTRLWSEVNRDEDATFPWQRGLACCIGWPVALLVVGVRAIWVEERDEGATTWNSEGGVYR